MQNEKNKQTRKLKSVHQITSVNDFYRSTCNFHLLVYTSNFEIAACVCAYTQAMVDEEQDTMTTCPLITSDLHVILRGEPKLMCACAIRCLSKCYCKV